MDKNKSKKKKMLFNLSVIFLREGNSFVAYSPALDLSTCGKTTAQAQRRFIEAATLFFETLNEWGTTEDVLAELGWQKEKKVWQPPTVISNKTRSVSVPAYV